MDKIFPVENATLPYWRSELHEIDSYRSTEELPEECDVVIIGAGISGVSTAYFLLDDNPKPPSIVLLDARQICSGATGRNGGHLMMVYPYIDKLTEAYGADAARELLLFQQAQVYAMKRVAEKEELDCDLVLTRVCETTQSQEIADERSRVYEKHRLAGLDYIDDVDLVGPKFAEPLSGVKGAKVAITVTAAQLWPYKFVTGLLAKLLKRTASLNVQTHTRVTSVSSDQDGKNTVSTPRGSIRAQTVIFATNAYTAGIAPDYYQKIVPTKGANSHIVPKDTAHPPPHLSHTYGLSFANGYRDYLIPRPDGGVICGGAKDTFGDQKELWFNVCDDSTVIESTRNHFETVMQDNFIGWERSGAAIDYLWSGIMGTTADALPHCGKVPGKNNQFILAGFNGAGMSYIFLSAKGIAKMVESGVPFEKSGMPRIFKSTHKRLVDDVNCNGLPRLV